MVKRLSEEAYGQLVPLMEDGIRFPEVISIIEKNNPRGQGGQGETTEKHILKYVK